MTSIDISERDNYAIKDAWPVNSLVGILYFLKKFKNICISNITEIQWKCIYIKNKCTRKLIIPDDFIDRIQLCEDDKTKRFIFSFLTLYDQNSKSKNADAHANVLIIDLQDRSVEHFEPHGDNPMFDQKQLHERLRELFIDTLGFENFYESNDFCPRESFQYMQDREQKMLPGDPGGFCQSWSIWWIYYRLKNANSGKSRKDLVDDAIAKMSTNMTVFIRKYAKFIVRERTRLIKEINKDWPVMAEMILTELDKPHGEMKVLVYYAFHDQIIREIEKITPTYHSARTGDNFYKRVKCQNYPCPKDKMCRLSTGNCVIKKMASEEIIVEGGKKYLIIKGTKAKDTDVITPTVENFKHVYIREYIYNKCADKLTNDELYMVLYYDNKPINGADLIWKNRIS